LADGADATATFDYTIPVDTPYTLPEPAYLFAPQFLKPQVEARAIVHCGDTVIELTEPIYFQVGPTTLGRFADGPYLVRAGVDDAVTVDLRLRNMLPTEHTPEVAVNGPAAWGFGGLSAGTVAFSMEDEERLFRAAFTVPTGTAPGDYPVTAVVGGDIGAETSPIQRSAAALAPAFLRPSNEGEQSSAPEPAAQRPKPEPIESMIRVVDVKVPDDINVGVIQSYDDTFVTTLERLDVPHATLGLEDFNAERLDEFTAVIVDIRAYAKRDDLVASNQALLDYMERGGTLLVMYQKTFE